MWIVGSVVVGLAILAVGLWWASLHARGRRAPEEHPPPSGLRPGRDETWDPHQRYDHGTDPPPAVEQRRDR